MLTHFKEKYIGSASFYKRYLCLALPMILQNAITNLVSFLDNIMVGQLGTEPMSGVAIVNQLIFVYNLASFGAVSAASIFGAQYFGKGNHKGRVGGWHTPCPKDSVPIPLFFYEPIRWNLQRLGNKPCRQRAAENPVLNLVSNWRGDVSTIRRRGSALPA